MNWHFPKENPQLDNRHMKRCTTSLLIREMQMKTTMRYHLTSVKIAVIKKTTNKKCWWECGEKCILMYCWWECKMMHPEWKTVCRFLKELQIELSYDTANPLLGIHLKKTDNSKILVGKDVCTPMFIAVFFTIAKIWKPPRVDTDRWMDKEDVVYIYNVYMKEYFSDIKMNEILPFAINGWTLGYYAKWNKSEKNKYYMI